MSALSLLGLCAELATLRYERFAHLRWHDFGYKDLNYGMCLELSCLGFQSMSEQLLFLSLRSYS